jgi:hypothetical protein
MASEIKVDTISEKTSANGVTIDGLNVKDSALVTAGSVPLSTIDIDGGTDIGAAIVDADLFIIDDGAGGTNRKVTASRIKTYAGGSDPSSADGDSLGTASLEWSDLYLADGGIIYFGNDQDITLTHDADVGLKLKSVATADDKPIILTLQTGETDIAANDVIGRIAFQAPDEGTGTDAILVAAAIQATSEGDFAADNNATKLEFMTGASESATTQMTISSGGIVGIGAGVPGDLGVGLHIKSGDSGSGVSANADELVIEGSGTDIGMSILTPTNGAGRINFSDSGGNDRGQFRYAHDSDAMFVRAGGNDVQKWTASEVCVNEDSDDVDFRVESNSMQHIIFVNGGTDKIAMNDTLPEGDITIQQGADDDVAFSLKSSDVSHGFTSKAEADTYMKIGKADGSLGGMSLDAFKENGIVAIKMSGNADGTPDTTKSTSANTIIEMHSYVRDGTTGGATSTSNGNLFSVFNGDTCRFIFDAEGDLHSDSGTTTYDAYDDAQLVRAFDLSHGRGVIDSKFDKFVAYNHEKLAELQLVGREKNGTPNHFINVTGMQRLHNGAIWQQYEKHNQLLDAVYDLAKEAVGEEKANAILDKHEVKRLQ